MPNCVPLASAPSTARVHSIFTADGRLFIESLSFAGAMQAFRANLHRIRRVA